MTKLEFIAALVGHLAWPIVVLSVFLVLREQLLSRLPSLNRLAYKGFEMEFRRELAEAERRLPETKAAPETENSAEARSELDELAEVSPRAALLESWLGFETTAASTLEAVHPGHPPPRSFRQLLQALEKADLLPAKEAGLLRDLRALRNSAVHESDARITTGEAKRYAALMRDFTELLASRAWARMPKNC